MSFKLSLKSSVNTINALRGTVLKTSGPVIREYSVFGNHQLHKVLSSNNNLVTRHFSSTGSNRNDIQTPENLIGKFRVDKPMLMLAFTCNKCETRSSHSISKQAYTSGSVLVQCPGCKNRHLIADHLKIFSDTNVNVEDILAAKGESVSTDLNDLVFEEIPDNLKGLIGHHAKDAPAEHQKEADPAVSPQLEGPKKDQS